MVRPTYVDKNGIKKGAWSEEEDEKLRVYIQRYGHWNWRLLPKYAGLARCGKSCRLRWVNYLKPGMKHGNFTKQEEDLIIQLHHQLGNKWSAIAAKLPGRTDNEVKNFWHTNSKKRNTQSIQIEPMIEDQNNYCKNQVYEEEQPNYNKTTLNGSASLDNMQSYDANSSDSIAQIFNNLWTEPFLVDTTFSQNASNNFSPLDQDRQDQFLDPVLFQEPYYGEFSSFDSSVPNSMEWNNIDDGTSSSTGSTQKPFLSDTSQHQFGYFSSQTEAEEIYDNFFQLF